jgi:hypothetical protein
MVRLGVLVLMLCGALAGCGAQMLATSAHELKVTRAVLYQNGIGYFERRGRVDGGVLTMRVRPDQIRDFLKSLTVVDLASGRAVSIALPIEKSRARQLADLPEQVRTQGGVLAIAQAFRGARCRIETDSDATGRLVGVENLGGENGAPDWRLTVLTDDGALRQLKVAEVRALHVLDGTLELGLSRALDVALDAGAWKPVEVAVRLAGKGAHELVVSYVVEMPTWKPAYRLVVGAGGQALLQGWAVVDNVSGDDWKDVRLSLTAGTPLAFTYDLYTPRFPSRPHLDAPDQLAQVPLNAFETAGGLAASDTPADQSAPASVAPPPPGAPAGGSGGRAKHGKKMAARGGDGDDGLLSKREEANAPAPPPPPPVTSEVLQRSYRAMVAGNTVGSLFRYDLDEPVTIGERQSALVNIVNAKVPGEEVLLFRVGADQVNPYRAVRFKNDSGFVLEAGPVAIYHDGGDAGGGTFLGEALASRIEKTAQTFVPYAIDGRVRVTLAEEQKEQGMTLVKVVRGVITAQTKLVTKYSYDVDNGSGETVTLYVRRERRSGWKLLAKEQIIEEGGSYYLPIALPKSGRTKVVVEEQTPVERTVDIWNDFGREVIGLYLANASADPRVAAQLKEALALRERIGALDGQVGTFEQSRQTLAEREAEVRNNIQVLGKASKNADLKKKLETTLADLETQLNDVTRKLVTASTERGEVRDRLAILMKEITLEPK